MLVSPGPASVDVDYLGTRALTGKRSTAPCRNRYAATTQLDAEQHILTAAAADRPQLVHPEQAEAAAVTACVAGQLSGGRDFAALATLLASGFGGGGGGRRREHRQTQAGTLGTFAKASTPKPRAGGVANW